MSRRLVAVIAAPIAVPTFVDLCASIADAYPDATVGVSGEVRFASEADDGVVFTITTAIPVFAEVPE